jgi:penicillin-binding protein 1A
MKTIKFFAYIGIFLFFLIFGIILYFIFQLPDDSSLQNYKPNVMSRIHASNGDLVKEFSKEYRIFIPVKDIPDDLKNAFISAEDKNFYRHFGVDPFGIIRAVTKNILNLFNDKRPEGASTITQQVAKNFLLSDELSISRKIKEGLLALKIEQTLSKDRILELYLNQIYLGSGTYGIAAASNRYFKKALSELDIHEMAFLAALPKAPSRYNPEKNYDLAFDRRNWVLERMNANGYIDKQELNSLKKISISTHLKENNRVFANDYYLEEIRKKIISIFGEDYLYNGGLSVRSSLNTEIQIIADKALKKGLLQYDKRHGFRGPVTNDASDNWQLKYINNNPPHNFLIAKIVKFDEQKNNARIEVLLNDKKVDAELVNFKWARESLSGGYLGPKISKVSDILQLNDIIYVSSDSQYSYNLEQIPKINGGIIVMDPHTGRVFALSGGFDFNISNFNRVIQAKRQPGSSFKPFVYMSALENGLQPNSLILDAPFVVDQGSGLGKWKPENYGKQFYGPSTLRKGIENSRNLMTIRIAQYLGMEKVSEIAERAGVMKNMPNVLSMALGAGETSLIELTAAYASFVNGGKKVEPTLIDRIQDRRGKNIFLENFIACMNCEEPYIEENPMPNLVNSSENIFDEAKSYQMVSILKGAVDRGTGRKTKIDGIEIAGKTGTTNNNTDAWFIGFTSDLIIGVYAGFDRPSSLGKRETGSSVAVPIFRDFVKNYYEEKPILPFTIPNGIELIRVNYDTGEISSNFNSSESVYEAFSKSDNLVNSGEILVGSEGFQIIQVIDEVMEEYAIY